MDHVFASLLGEQSASAFLFFSIVWLIMRKRDGKKTNVSIMWLICGVFATAFIAGVVRFMSIWVIGGHAALEPDGYTRLSSF